MFLALSEKRRQKWYGHFMFKNAFIHKWRKRQQHTIKQGWIMISNCLEHYVLLP